MKKITILFLLTVVSIIKTQAHALWLQAPATAKKGQATEVRVFFGEYHEKEADSAQKWFSNLKNFELQLISPTGKITKLDAVADTKSYKANFTPSEDGTYLLSVVHHVADVYSKAKIEYYAFAQTVVGKASNNVAFPQAALLNFKPSKPFGKTGQVTPLTLSFKNDKKADQKIEVITPAFAKEEIKTDANGVVNFTPKQAGPYFIEAFVEEKATGEQNGKPYEKVWHVVTYFNEII